jgi:hypothetical protein
MANGYLPLSALILWENGGGCKKLCVSGHFAGNCFFQKWIKNDDTQSLTHATQRCN